MSRMGGLSSVGIYLYEDIYYRQWVTEIALAFYEGRQDEFVWLDLVRQFRNPEKQQILPLNLTKEVVDESSILYRDEPIYQVVDQNGKVIKKDQDLWKKIMKDSRYLTFMDRLDRWTRLLGTVLVKVSFVDDQGNYVDKNNPGTVQLDMLHGGVYDIRHGASPYYLTELLIGFGTKFSGFQGAKQLDGVNASIPSPSNLGAADISAKQSKRVNKMDQLGKINRIYWSPTSHKSIDEDNQEFEGANPYGIIPAVPFFNQDPAHYYFLPINEPLIYANHAINMRITDLNHIAKFQSFGVPVVKGVERPTSLRQGRPVDDFNQLKGGTAQSRFGGISGTSGFGAGGNFRTFDAGLGITRDGNADANALGVSLGPDTAIAVGEKGDFKFAHPSADIRGLLETIQNISDMVRINHGLRPKWKQEIPSSGFALLMEKMGVIEENVRRSKLFKEREQQLFQVVKTLWNTHNAGKSGNPRFSEDATLDIVYKNPEFPVDPKTSMETIAMENKLLDSGDRETFKKLYPHMSEADINKLIKQRRKDKLEQAKEDAKVEVERAKILKEAGIMTEQQTSAISSSKHSVSSASTITMQGDSAKSNNPSEDVMKPKIDNKAKHSEQSSKQPKRNGDPRNK